MARSGNRRQRRLSYNSLESRKMLAGDSVFFVDTEATTLHIVAGDSNVEGAEFANDMSFAIDSDTNELVVTEANANEQRFDLADINRISYRGTFLNDRFTNNTDINARVVGFAGDDTITSGGGNDVIIGANGNDTIFPGNGDDYAAGNAGDDMIIETEGSTGNDRFHGGPGIDEIDSGDGDDRIAGSEGDDILRTGAGEDFAFGNDGDDVISSGSERDFVYGGLGDDQIDAGEGDDRALGQEGDDTILGGTGEDSIVGGDGNDTIDGGEDDDHITGGLGNDSLTGGPGIDFIIAGFANAPGNPFGFDTVFASGDDAIDTVLAHPIDTIVDHADDIIVNADIVRRNQQIRFLEQNIQNPGWQETDSGLQFLNVVEGTGASPDSNDIVRVNYVGVFTDGTQFDANDDISFGLNQVIAGWTEGLQLMKVGGTMDLAIGSNLAYGPNNRGNIPGGSTLLFRVELLEVIPVG